MFYVPVTIGLVMLLMTGCEQVTISTDPDATPPGGYPSEPVVHMPETVIDSDAASGDSSGMMQIQEKYATAMEELLSTNHRNRQLEEANKELASRLVEAERELGDANEKLFELRNDLDKWKKNVYGFQGEMREALVAVMKSQERIIRLLNGEEPAVPVANAQGN
jgi:hypothetical protein